MWESEASFLGKVAFEMLCALDSAAGERTGCRDSQSTLVLGGLPAF